MAFRRLLIGLAIALFATGVADARRQTSTTPAATPSARPIAIPASELDVAHAREFLSTARVVRARDTLKGVTKPRRITLSDGRTEHDAVFQTVDEFEQIRRFRTGRIELNFRDSYHFNIAAFEVASLLGLAGMVPVTVERTIDGDRGSLSWWVDWRWDEQMRVKEKLRPPDPLRWRQQWDVARVFGELIEDTDRNQTNILISEQWQLWLVDFTRAFRRSREPGKPELLRYCSRDLLTRLRAMDEAALEKAVGDHLGTAEREALMHRREAILAHFDRLVAERGDEVVLF